MGVWSKLLSFVYIVGLMGALGVEKALGTMKALGEVKVGVVVVISR